MASRIDPNASTPERIRRNFQILAQGAATETISVDAPLTNTGSIGLALAASSGLEVSSSALRIDVADTSLQLAAGGVSVRLASSSGLEVSTGLRLDLVTNSGLTLSATGVGILLNPTTPALSLTSGLSVLVAANQGLTKTASGLETVLNGTSLAKGASGLSVTVPVADPSGHSGEFLTNNGTVTSWAAVSTTVADADYGDITVSGSGTVWTIDSPMVQDIISLADPGADRVVFWDDSGGELTFLAMGNGLSITTTTLAVLLDTNSGLEFNSSGLRVDAVAPLTRTASGLDLLMDDDSIQLDGSNQIEVRKLRGESSDPGSPVDGEIWQNTTDDMPRMKQPHGISDLVQSPFVGNTISVASIASVTTEQDFDSNSQFTFPANVFKVGQLYRIKVMGRYRTDSGNLSLRMYLGGSSAITSTLTPTVTGTGVATWWAEAFFRVNTVGAAGSFSSFLTFVTTLNNQSVASAGWTVDTTGTALLKFSAQASAADADHAMSIFFIAVELVGQS